MTEWRVSDEELAKRAAEVASHYEGEDIPQGEDYVDDRAALDLRDAKARIAELEQRCEEIHEQGHREAREQLAAIGFGPTVAIELERHLATLRADAEEPASAPVLCTEAELGHAHATLRALYNAEMAEDTAGLNRALDQARAVLGIEDEEPADG